MWDGTQFVGTDGELYDDITTWEQIKKPRMDED